MVLMIGRSEWADGVMMGRSEGTVGVNTGRSGRGWRSDDGQVRKGLMV